MTIEKIHTNRVASNTEPQVTERPFLIEDLLLCIFRFLNCVELSRAGRVCRQWNRLSKDERLGPSVTFRGLIHREPKKHEILMDSRFVYTLTDKFVIIGDKYGELHFWDKMKTKMVAQATAHEKRICFLRCQKDKLLTATRKSIKIWQLNETGLIQKLIAENELQTNRVIRLLEFMGNHVFTCCQTPESQFVETLGAYVLEDNNLHLSENFNLKFTHTNKFKAFYCEGSNYAIETTERLYLIDQKLEVFTNFHVRSLPFRVIDWVYNNGLLFVYFIESLSHTYPSLAVYTLDRKRVSISRFIYAFATSDHLYKLGKYIRIQRENYHLIFEYLNNNLVQVGHAKTADNDYSFMVLNEDIFLIEPHQISISNPLKSLIGHSSFKKLVDLDLTHYSLPDMAEKGEVLTQDLDDDKKAHEPLVANERAVFNFRANIKFSDRALYCTQVIKRFSLDILDFKSANPLKRPAEEEEDKKPKKFREISSES